MLEDVSVDALQAALRGLSAREQAISDNIANVNTPYFNARRVAFEGQLRQALNNGDNPLTAAPSAFYTGDPAGLNGNNVDLNAETVLGVQTQMQYDLALRAVGDRFTLWRSAARGA
ncbi:MAG TPA: flagellar biosynthesis protein FlgB [Kineosporiaceae bacterium]|nr:flagellar biosynthesis protein FlgB [Kineosporiaceae bacterium]